MSQAEPRCPLGCAPRPQFAGRQNRRHRFVCQECRIEFEVVVEPYRARAKSTLFDTQNATAEPGDNRNANAGKRIVKDSQRSATPLPPEREGGAS